MHTKSTISYNHFDTSFDRGCFCEKRLELGINGELFIDSRRASLREKMQEKALFLPYLTVKLFSLFSLGIAAVFFLCTPSVTHAANLYWVGTSGGNTSTASNWATINPGTCGGGAALSAPGSGDVAIFDPDCDNSATINSTFTVQKIEMQSGYTGTVTQAAGVAVTIDPGTSGDGLAIAGGTFTAGDTAVTINDGNFNQTGGTFTNSTGGLVVEQDFTFSSGTFTNTSATVTFSDSSTTDDTDVTCSTTLGGTFVVTKDSSGDFTNGANCTVPLGATPTTTLGSSGTYTNSGTLTVASGTWTLTGAATLTNGGTITHSGDGWDINDASLTNNNGATITYSGTAITMDRNFTQNGTFNLSGITITFDDSTTADDSTVTCGTLGGTTVITKDTGGDFIVAANCTIALGADPTTTIGNTSTGTYTNNGTMTVASGTWTINNSAATTANTLTNAGTITHSGNGWDINDTNLTNNDGATITYSGTAITMERNFTQSGTFNLSGITVTFDDSSSSDDTTVACSTLGGTVVITKDSSGDFIVDTNCTVALGAGPTSTFGSTGTYTNNGTLTVVSGTWTINNASSIRTLTNAGTITHSGSGWDINATHLTNNLGATITYSGTAITMETNFTHNGTFDLSGKTITFDGSSSNQHTNLTCGTTFGGSIAVNKTTTNTFTLASDCTVAGSFTRTDGSVANPSSSYTLTVQGDITFTNTSDTTGGSNLTLTAGGGSNQNINMGGETWSGNFNVNKSGNAATLTADFTSSGFGITCTVIEGTFSINGKAFSCASTFTIEDGGTLQRFGTSGESVTTPTLNSGSTVIYTGDGDSAADTITVTTMIANYHHLTINSTDGATDTFDLGAALDTNGTFTLAAGAFTQGSTATLATAVVSGGTWTRSAHAVTFEGTLTISGGTYNANGQTSTVTGLGTVSSGTYTASSATQTFNAGLTISGGTYTGSTGALDVNGALTLSSGTLTAPSGTFTVSGNWAKSGGTFTPGSNTVTFDGTSGTKTLTSGSSAFYSITIDDGGGTLTLELQDALDVDGNLTITGGTLDTKSGGNYGITLAGNWSNSDTFTARSGTVTLDGTSQSLTGTTSFYNLSKTEGSNNSTDETVTFAASTTFTISNTLTLDGRDDNDRINLVSSSSGTRFTLNVSGAAQSVDYLDVTDSNASSNTITCSNCVDGGNNDNGEAAPNWAFVISVDLSGTVYSDEGSTALGNMTVRLAINGTDNSTQESNASTGAYSFTSITLSTGDVLTFYLEDETQDAVTVTVVGSSNLSSVDLYQNRLITRHDNSGSLTNSNLSTAAVASEDDISNIYSVSGGTLTVASGKELFIPSSHTFAPGGGLVVDDIDINGTLTLSSNAATVSGTWDATGGTATSSGTVTFTSTSTETFTSNGTSFGTVVFNGSGGVWDLGSALTATTLTLTAGTLDINGSNLTVSGTFTNNATLRLQGGETTFSVTMDTDTGTVIYDGTSTYSSLKAGNSYNNLTFNGSGGSWTHTSTLDVNGNLTITAGTLVSSGQNITLAGNWSNAGSYTSGSNTVTFDGSGAQSLTSGGTGTSQDFNNLTVNKSAETLSLATNDIDIDGTLTVTSGTYSPGSLATTAGALTINGGTFTGSSGAVDVNGTVTLSSGTLTAPSGTFTVSGDFTISGSPTFTHNSGTVTFDGSSNQTLTTNSATFSGVTLNNSGSSGSDRLVISGALDVDGTLTITDGVLYLTTNNPNVNTAGAVSIASGGAVTKGTGTWTFDGTSAITYTDSTATPQNIGIVAITKSNGTPSNNKVTLGSNMTVDTMTISANNTLDLGSSSYTLKLANSGATGTVLTVSGTLTPGTSTVQYSATNSGGNVTVAATTYNSLKISGGETYDLGGNLTSSNALTGNLTIDSGAILDAVSGSNYGIELAGTWSNSGTFTARSGTVTLTGTSTFSDTTSFYNLTLNGSGKTVTLGGALTITNNLTITAGTLDVSATGCSSASCAITVTGNFANSGTFTARSGTVTFDKSSSTQTLASGGSSFYRLTHSGAGTLQLSSNALTVTNTLTNSAGTVDLNGQNLTTTGATYTNDGTLQLQGGETLTDFSNDTDSGTTLYVGTSTYSLLAAGNSYNNLTFNGSGGSWTHTSTLDVNGNLTITAGTLVSSGQNITLAGNWSNAGSYTSGSNTVTFDGTSTQTLVSGGTGTSNDFNSVTKSGSGTLQFSTNGVDIDGTLTINSSTTVDLNGQNLTSVATLVNNGTLLLEGGETVTITTYDADSGTTTYDGTSSYTTSLAAGNSYYHLTFNGSGGVWEPNGAVTVNGNLTITAGTFDIDGQNLTVTGTFSNDATLRLTGSETVSYTNDTNSGTITYDGSSTYTGLAAGNSYYNVTFANASGTWKATSAPTVSGAMTVSAGTYDFNGVNLSVAGNLINSGTLANASGRTVTLNGTTQTLTPGSSTTLGTVDLTGSSGTVSLGSNFSIGTLLQIAANRILSLVSYIITLAGSLTNSGTVTEGTGYLAKASSDLYIGDSNFDIDDIIEIPGDKVYVSITDEDGNLDGTSANTLSVTVSCPTDSEAVTLTETGNATEVFRNSGLTTAVYSGSATNNNGTLSCADAATITVSYTDAQDSGDTRSDTATATTDTIPTAPSSFAGTAASSTSITWTWTDNASNEDGFKLYDSSNTLIATISTPNTTSYTETGLSASTSYTRKIVAYNDAGNSSYSGSASVTTNAAATPTPAATAAPTSPSLKNPADGATVTTINPTFTFGRSTDSDDGIDTYSLIINPGASNQKTITFDDPAAGTSFTLSNASISATADIITVTITNDEWISDGSTYTWKARATDNGANTADSDIRSFTVDVADETTATPAITTTTSSPTTPSPLTGLATRPPTITDVIEQIARGETPTRAPVDLQLDTLEKQATVRLEKQADNLALWLRRFLPAGWVEWIDRAIAYAVDTLKTKATQLALATRNRLASVVGFSREQLALLGQLIGRQQETIIAQRQRMVKQIQEQLTQQGEYFTELSQEQLAFIADQLATAEDRIAIDPRIIERLRLQLPQLNEAQVQEIITAVQTVLQTTQSTGKDVVDELQGIPRVVGRIVIDGQRVTQGARTLLIAARNNRLELARQSDQKITTVFDPLVRAGRSLAFGARVTLQHYAGRFQKSVAITNVVITPHEPDSVTISWTTNQLAKGKVNWGTTTSYGAHQQEQGGESFEADFATDHSITLTHLNPNTKYYFEVLATSITGEQTYDAYYSFTTPAFAPDGASAGEPRE